MADIKSIDAGHMNNGAHFTYMTNVLNRAEADEHIKVDAATQVADLKAALAVEDKYFKTSDKNLKTDIIAAADAERDKLCRNYLKTLKALMNMPDETIANSAKALVQMFIDYELDPDAQLDKQTGILLNMVGDWEGKHAQDVTNTNTGKYVELIKAANERVHSLMVERSDEEKEVPVGALKSARKQTDIAYRALVKMVNALIMVNGETDYADFVKFLNYEIKRYKEEVLNQKVPEGTKPDDTTPVDPTPEDPNEGEDVNPGQPTVDDDEEDDRPVVQ